MNDLPALPTPKAAEGKAPRSFSEVGPEKFIPVDEVVKRSGISSNTLRYYTKIGLLPYMSRRLPYPTAPSTVGHYPDSVLETLKRIKELKKQGLDNETIKKALKPAKTGLPAVTTPEPAAPISPQPTTSVPAPATLPPIPPAKLAPPTNGL